MPFISSSEAINAYFMSGEATNEISIFSLREATNEICILSLHKKK